MEFSSFQMSYYCLENPCISSPEVRFFKKTAAAKRTKQYLRNTAYFEEPVVFLFIYSSFRRQSITIFFFPFKNSFQSIYSYQRRTRGGYKGVIHAALIARVHIFFAAIFKNGFPKSSLFGNLCYFR